MNFLKGIFGHKTQKVKNQKSESSSDEDDYSDSQTSSKGSFKFKSSNNRPKIESREVNQSKSEFREVNQPKSEFHEVNKPKSEEIDKPIKITTEIPKEVGPTNNGEKTSMSKVNSEISRNAVNKERSHLKKESYSGKSSDGLKQPSFILSEPKIISLQNKDAYVYKVESHYGKMHEKSDLEFVIYIPIDTAVHWLIDKTEKDDVKPHEEEKYDDKPYEEEEEGYESQEEEEDEPKTENDKPRKKKKKKRVTRKVLKSIVVEEEGSEFSLGPLRPQEERGPVKIVET